MKLVILFGPPAVGKMTVGQQLANLTGFKLFHNHMTIETRSQLLRVQHEGVLASQFTVQKGDIQCRRSERTSGFDLHICVGAQ
jgi:shikimate kinase